MHRDEWCGAVRRTICFRRWQRDGRAHQRWSDTDDNRHLYGNGDPGGHCSGRYSDRHYDVGGFDNADTEQTITQYFATVPSADLEVALRVDAACMRDMIDSDAEWKQEKGAIEQEVARDLSEPTYKFITRLNQVIERPDTPSIRGMVAKVPHLVEIVQG